MAHGQDVANLGRIPGVTAATRWVVGRSSAVIANSRWLAGRLTEQDPGGRAEDRGRRLRSRPRRVLAAPRGPRPARELGWEGEGPAFLCVGSLIERKNVVAPGGRLRLAGPRAARLRRRRAAARGARRKGRRHPRRADPAVGGSRVGRGLRRPLPAVADRALRPGDARGDGDGAHRARDQRSAGRRSSSHPEAGVLVDPQDPAAPPPRLELAATKPTPNPAPAGRPPSTTSSARPRRWSRCPRCSGGELQVGRGASGSRPRRAARPPAPRGSGADRGRVPRPSSVAPPDSRARSGAVPHAGAGEPPCTYAGLSTRPAASRSSSFRKPVAQSSNG